MNIGIYIFTELEKDLKNVSEENCPFGEIGRKLAKLSMPTFIYRSPS
jgi:hypothetical protein